MRREINAEGFHAAADELTNYAVIAKNKSSIECHGERKWSTKELVVAGHKRQSTDELSNFIINPHAPNSEKRAPQDNEENLR